MPFKQQKAARLVLEDPTAIAQTPTVVLCTTAFEQAPEITIPL